MPKRLRSGTASASRLQGASAKPAQRNVISGNHGGGMGRDIEGAFVRFQESGQTAGLFPSYQDASIKRDGHL